MTKKQYRALREEAREASAWMVERLAKIANDRGSKDASTFAGLTACEIMETIMSTLALDLFPAGSQEGAEWFGRIYQSALKNALTQWHGKEMLMHDRSEATTGELH